MEDKELLEKFGLKIKVERAKRRLSQEQLAELAGLSSKFISNIELTKQNPSLTSIKNIAEALGITMSELLDINNI